MRRGIRWYLTGNLIVIGVILAIVVFWQAAEAPLRVVESETEPPTVQLKENQMQTLAGPAEGAVVPATATATTTRAPAATPTETARALVASPVSSGSQPTVRVPILMYHRIDWLPPNADALRTSLSITPPDFDAQLRFLKERGFTSLTLYEVYQALQGKRALPPKPIVLTFDDGYADNYANAFPILQRNGFLGTFFILTDLMGTGEYMSWEQAREMAAVGMKIEVHSRTHADLSKMTAAQVASQAKGAREAIQARLGVDPKFYCYPSGKYNDEVINIIKANGYLAAVTVNYGSEHSLQNAFEMKRVRIDGRESFAVFARKVGENP